MRQTKGGNMVIDYTSAHNLPHLAPSSMGEGELYALLLWCKCFFRIPYLQPYGHAYNYLRKVGFCFMGLYVHAYG